MVSNSSPKSARHRVLAGALSLSVALCTAALLPSAPVAHADSKDISVGTYRTFTDSGGYQLRYHRFEGGEAGVLFYFDGDGTRNFENPQAKDRLVQNLHRQAAARGFDLVFFDHPGNGLSWWFGIDADRAASAVREFVLAEDTCRVQLAGYSGGAEFLARHLMIWNEWVEELPTGVLMIGGGGVAYRTPSGPQAKNEPTYYHWVVGDRDSYGATQPAHWSAYQESAKARDAYASSGHQSAERTVVADTHHTNYKFDTLVATDLDRLAAAPAAEPSKQAPAPTTQAPAPSKSKASSPASPSSAPQKQQPTASDRPTASQPTATQTPSVAKPSAPSTSATPQPEQKSDEPKNPLVILLKRILRALGWIR